MANTMFEVKISNVSRNNTQNVTGLFGSFSDSDFTAADCDAGFLCKRMVSFLWKVTQVLQTSLHFIW